MPAFDKLVSAPISSDQSVSVSVRKIGNGYIERVSRCGADGSYTESEVYTKERPQIGLAQANDPLDKLPSSMSKAIKALNGRK